MHTRLHDENGLYVGPEDLYGAEWHDLKVWPEYFDALRIGLKSFELRKDDRGFKEGCFLVLREYNPGSQGYTGRVVVRHVHFILRGGQFGLEEGYVCMGIVPV